MKQLTDQARKIVSEYPEVPEDPQDPQDDSADAKGKQSKNEKKARKAISRLGLKDVPGKYRYTLIKAPP